MRVFDWIRRLFEPEPEEVVIKNRDGPSHSKGHRYLRHAQSYGALWQTARRVVVIGDVLRFYMPDGSVEMRDLRTSGIPRYWKITGEITVIARSEAEALNGVEHALLEGMPDGTFTTRFTIDAEEE